SKVILSSNEPDELDRVARDCSGEAPPMVLPIDLTDAEDLCAKADQVLDRFGCVDILINNGGVSHRSLVKETDLAIDRRMMEINYFGHVVLTKALLPSMLTRKSGHIVVTTSVLGIIPVPLRSAYCAAKHALHGFFDTLRAETWEENIQVTLVCPAAVRTKISVNALTGDGGTFGRMDNVVDKGITPEACADIIMRAIRKGKREVVVGKGTGVYGVYMKRYLPGLFFRLLKRSEVV
ncbi:SDR family NAD(P)-dependent oxidoreductase, partial [Thermodesulfobacteriota bacterium]